MTSQQLDMHVLLRAFVDELVRCGVYDACTCPGSRSAPLVLALTRHPRLTTYSHVDERCAGFFALGMAKDVGMPVPVAVTSGTAAAELTPAVHEAHEARVPMIVLTADRPPELREVGAGQTIDQIHLYGSAAKWFVEVGNHEATPERLRWMRGLACRAVWAATAEPRGVVHLNFPLREPLVPPAEVPEPEPGRAGNRPWILERDRGVLPDPVGLEDLAKLLERRPRGVIVAGRREHATLSVVAAAAGLSETAGYPLLADPLSWARVEGVAVASYDALLRSEAFADAHAPELVIRVGDLPTSKPLRSWLARARDAVQIALLRDGVLQDPDGAVSIAWTVHEATVLAELNERLQRAPDAAWVDAWGRADALATEAIDGALGDELSEPWVARELGRRLSSRAILFVASSMPVRDVETFFPATGHPPRVLSNRGANGIDGTVSSAFGVAARSNEPTVLLIGDVALAHDVGGLLAASRLGLRLTIVLLNNGGGGIFHFLPIAGEGDVFEEHVATPTGLDFATMAQLYGCEHRLIADTDAFRAELDASLNAPRTTILEVRTDRVANLALHQRVWGEVDGALRA
jgi:2-succinyl-5-enolpyruvyl-6-hydroxy-3-cyclohexene-1-carboxylate synthase